MKSPRIRQFNAETNDLLHRYRETRDGTFYADFLDISRSVVYGCFLKRDFTHSDVEEAFHQGSIDLFRNVDKWDPALGDAITLFFSCVQHRLYDIRKKRIRRKSKERNFSDFWEQDEGYSQNDIADVLNAAPTPEPQDEERLSDDDRRLIRDAAETLKPIHREVAHLMLYGGLRRSDIARHLGLTRQATADRFKLMRKVFSELPPVQRIYGITPTETLTDRQWAVVRLVHEQGKSFVEAGRILGITRQSARTAWRGACIRIAQNKRLQELTGIVPASKP